MVRATLMFVLTAACATGTTTTDDTTTDDVVDDSGVGPAVTYHRDVRPVLEARCGACHVDGGVAPFSVAYDETEWAEGAAWWAQSAVASVDDGAMPPWMPDDSCHPVAESRALTDGERDLLLQWRSLDYPEGDPADHVGEAKAADPEEALGAPSLELDAKVPYKPNTERPDDYRCFVLDHTFDEDAWMTAFTVAPDQLEVVHHVILYRLDPQYADEVVQWDADEEGPGYTCYGSPGTWDAETLAGWAPGAVPEIYADDTARLIEKGSVLVMQMHYNTLNVGDAPPFDQTGVKLWLLPEGETPRYRILSLPFAKTDLNIPAGNPSHTETFEVGLGGYLRRNVPIRGAFPHMHQLGTSISVEVLRDDDTSECVMDIPNWDFNWQQTYFFPQESPIWVNRTDRLRISCTYDNSASNQPVVNGEQLTPRDVAWGDGSLDEMCLMYLYVTLPTDI